MLITTLEELRLFFPANAIDSIDSMTGIIETAEYNTLRDKLGKPLYNLLNAYYSALGTGGIGEYINAIQSNIDLPPYARLLKISQSIVANDAMANAVGKYAVSINGAGINMVSADDYATADKDKIAEFKRACHHDCHDSINVLLNTLEEWVRDLANDDIPEDYTTDVTEICTAWKSSRYYFLAAGMIIPSMQILLEYWNIIYDERDKFIQMLPDIRYIQEEIFAQSIGDDFMEYLAEVGIKGTTDKILARIITRLRKAAVTHLEARTLVVKTDNDRRIQAHNEAVSLTDQVIEYISLNQSSLPAAALTAFKKSPLYTPDNSNNEPVERKFENNRKGNAFFAVPALR